MNTTKAPLIKINRMSRVVLFVFSFFIFIKIYGLVKLSNTMNLQSVNHCVFWNYHFIFKAQILLPTTLHYSPMHGFGLFLDRGWRRGGEGETCLAWNVLNSIRAHKFLRWETWMMSSWYKRRSWISWETKCMGLGRWSRDRPTEMCFFK